MKKLSIGVLGPSEIAFRRTVPAFIASDCFEYVGVAHASVTEWSDRPLEDSSIICREAGKAQEFVTAYGGGVYNSYEELLSSDIDAVYIPLPPALHKKWVLEAIRYGKHIFVEKPFTICETDTDEVIKAASKASLAVHENFAFIFHKQIHRIIEIINSGEIGELRLIRTAFGFPYRGANDFRYHKTLGGGALLDCGGYPIKLAAYFLGDTTKVVCASRAYAKAHDVDVYGHATLSNARGQTAQIAFGMDNAYKCELEIWGSKGTIYTPRVYTPPADMRTQITVKTKSEEVITIDVDDQFRNSAEAFHHCVMSEEMRLADYQSIRRQAALMDKVGGSEIYG